MSYNVIPNYQLSPQELADYERDGVIMIKQALDKNWLNLAEAGLEKARRNTSFIGKFMSRKTKGYNMDIFMWKHIDEIRDLIYYGPFAHWAHQLMNSKEVRFFYDQMFIKEPGTDAPTPWHQDLSFWPISGNQICSFWIPFDKVNADSSGLLYVKGSHKWPQKFKAISPDYIAQIIDDNMDDLPDINSNPEKYELVNWEMEPGDVLMFHPLTLHGSKGNQSRTQVRRALALRWIGDDVIWTPSAKKMPVNFHHNSEIGGPIRGAAFPRIIPSIIDEEISSRRSVETPSNMRTLSSLINNFKSYLRLKSNGFDVEKEKMRWNPK